MGNGTDAGVMTAGVGHDSLEMRDAESSRLRQISAVNELIKQANHASVRIGLIAINASLVAGRAGRRAAGFYVAAEELHRFSTRMSRDMEGWRATVYELVRETAQARRRANALRLLEQTSRFSAASQSACGKSRRDFDESIERNTASVQKLLERVGRTEKQDMVGALIARSALIEASYGGALERPLRQVGETIRDSLEDFFAQTRRVRQTIEGIAA